VWIHISDDHTDSWNVNPGGSSETAEERNWGQYTQKDDGGKLLLLVMKGLFDKIK
jgi:hypothetical protein